MPSGLRPAVLLRKHPSDDSTVLCVRRKFSQAEHEDAIFSRNRCLSLSLAGVKLSALECFARAAPSVHSR